MKEEILDIRKIFKSKNPGLAPYLPGFVYSYLNRILHIDFLNFFLEKHGAKQGVEFANAAIEEFKITTEIKGFDNIPESGKLFFVSNHPLGGFDGLILISILGEKFPHIKSLSNDILSNISNFKDIFIPVNKHGKQSITAARKMNEIYEQGLPVLTFPAGLVSRKRKGIIRDTVWKKNFITKSKEYKYDVVPIFVSGRCTNFFYRLANLRKLLRIKSNLEMFFLPDETFKHHNEHVRVTFGKPVPWTTFDKRHSPDAWASKMQDHVYHLSVDEESEFSKII